MTTEPDNNTPDPAGPHSSEPAVARVDPTRVRTGFGSTARVRSPLRRHGSWWLSIAAFVLAVLAFVLIVPRISALQSEVAHRLQAIDQRLVELQSADQPMSAGLRELRDRVAVLERRDLDAAGLQAQIARLYRNLAEDSTDVLLAELESSLVLASQQLALGVGAPAALAALQEIDARLARHEDPSLQPLRASLMHDIERVKAYPAANVGSLALRLDTLMRSIDRFALLSSVSMPRRDADRPPGTGLDALRGEVEQLFRVRRVDRPEAMLLAPDQAYFLRQNLRLLLLEARLSLLLRNEKLFRSDVERAIDWLQSYYDKDDQAVTAAVAQLRQLLGARIVLEPPTLADSLSAVRGARAARAMRDIAR